MASSSKKKTTMAKLNREATVRERRLRKQAKKDARKQAAADQAGRTSETPIDDDGSPAAPIDAGEQGSAS